MKKEQIITALIQRTREDWVSYFSNSPIAEKAEWIVDLAISGDSRILEKKSELKGMIPDTENDGSWKCSYALNTGVMIESLIEYREDSSCEHFETAVSMFFDSVDFKVQQDLEREGTLNPTEEEITTHPLYVREKLWFDDLTVKQWPNK
jgi:hypothetical protein